MKVVWSVLLLISLGSCGDKGAKVIAKIPEASGIDYCQDTKHLIVANDEGSYYEISKKGKILREVKLGKYDLEGVICETDRLIFVRENKGLLIVNRNNGAVEKIKVRQAGQQITLFDKKAGVEGIAKKGNRLYLAKQSKKKKDSFIAVVVLEGHTAYLKEVIYHGLPDTAGLTYHEGVLYMVSDKKDQLIAYDLEKKKQTEKFPLPKGAWEGITFDHKGALYLADDEGRVVKYKKGLGEL